MHILALNSSPRIMKPVRPNWCCRNFWKGQAQPGLGETRICGSIRSTTVWGVATAGLRRRALCPKRTTMTAVAVRQCIFRPT